MAELLRTMSFQPGPRRRLSKKLHKERPPGTNDYGGRLDQRHVQGEGEKRRRRLVGFVRRVFGGAHGPGRNALGGASVAIRSSGATVAAASSPQSQHRPPLDPNKPLPLPPGDARANAPSGRGGSRPLLKLDRIMATLTDDDVEKLFSGAPQFFARNESHFSGAPHPSVAFPFDEELEIRDLADCIPIDNKAWSGVTAWPHLTKHLDPKPATRRSSGSDLLKTKAHFHIKCRERPNMLSMQGLEKGTMGYQAALELPVGDSLEEAQFGFESIGKKAKAIVEARTTMLSHHGWLRRIPEGEVLDRLRRKGDLYRDNDLKKRSSEETYRDLFHSFMRPSNVLVDKADEHGLNNQINALLKCLGTGNVWIDFSRVEWRIRLGQILWGQDDGDELDDSSQIEDAHGASERIEERYWLLLQILISAELLIRLDAVTEGQEIGTGAYRPIDVVHFERAATPTVKWSLILARSWLENVEVVKDAIGIDSAQDEPPRFGGWLATLASKMSLRSHHGQEDYAPSPPQCYTFKGRNAERQVNGLNHFARKLRWPGLNTYEARISRNAVHSADGTARTPFTNPSTAVPSDTSYFGAWDVTLNRGPQNERLYTQRRKMAAALHASGWLSKSYVFGLMLPGEVLSHYLMATLLENDSAAMAKLGSFANLCGGFVYSDMSFWSTACIVGRVLAAGKGSAECMGWISTEIVPVGMSDTWVNVDSKETAEESARIGKKARIWAKKRIERESSILGDGRDNSVLPADFIIPHENMYSTPPSNVQVELRSLKLLPPKDSTELTPFTELTPTPVTDTGKPPELVSYPATVAFSVSFDGTDDDFDFSLSFEVNFVTAHPCSPSQRVKFLKSASSPTIQQIDVSGSDKLGKTSRTVQRAGHPLHKFYKFTVIHISDLLKRREATLGELLSESDPRYHGKTTTKGSGERVLVIDCITNTVEPLATPVAERYDTTATSPILDRSMGFPAAAKMHLESRRRHFGSDLEILVRALCSEKGWNALISRRKRGCLACAIREAGALGWRVIIRVE